MEFPLEEVNERASWEQIDEHFIQRTLDSINRIESRNTKIQKSSSSVKGTEEKKAPN